MQNMYLSLDNDKIFTRIQVFVKPIGAQCNLGCQYCYYLDKTQLYPEDEKYQMPEEILEAYIIQQLPKLITYI